MQRGFRMWTTGKCAPNAGARLLWDKIPDLMSQYELLPLGGTCLRCVLEGGILRHAVRGFEKGSFHIHPARGWRNRRGGKQALGCLPSRDGTEGTARKHDAGAWLPPWHVEYPHANTGNLRLVPGGIPSPRRFCGHARALPKVRRHCRGSWPRHAHRSGACGRTDRSASRTQGADAGHSRRL
jgi:hypothetical protein